MYFWMYQLPENMQPLILTFGGSVGTIRGDLSHAASMATEGYQSGDDGRLSKAHVAHDSDPTALACLTVSQDILQLLEQPISAHKHRVRSDAGNLKQQRL